MSADNMICVQQRLDGKWWTWMDFASNDIYEPSGVDARSFDTKEMALLYAADFANTIPVLEYGIQVLDSQKIDITHPLSDMVAVDDQGRILHLHRWEERPLYGVWCDSGGGAWLNGKRGELIWSTHHIGLARAWVNRANELFAPSMRVCIIGDDGQPVELDE